MDNQYNYQVPEQNISPEGQNSQTPPKKPFKMPKIIVVLCFAIVFGVVGGAAFQTTNFIGNKILGISELEKNKKEIDSVPTTKSSNTVVSDVSEVAANVMPSVVSITNMSVQQVQNFFGGVTEQENESSGSGIIIGKNDKELLILTNNHVVEGSNTLTISFVDDKSVEAQVKGTDAEKDLAVVAVQIKDIEESTMDDISVATLGDSTKLKVGEPAIAIGNALGYGQSVTTGVISALDRNIEMEWFNTALIQTDAAINPGNSGGALVNANGEVIGINTVKVAADAVEGMGYAIPISDANETIEKLMNQETKEKVPEKEKGYIGIKGVDVTPESAEKYSMPMGVYISEAVEGGAAQKAGITRGSIITSLEGTKITDMATLQNQLAYYAAGETVSIVLQIPTEDGEYKEEKIDIKLDSAS